MSVRPALPICSWRSATAARPARDRRRRRRRRPTPPGSSSPRCTAGVVATASTWQRDYVELYNPTDSPVDLAGTSVQYRSATGTANPSGVTALTGTIPAEGLLPRRRGHRHRRRAGADAPTSSGSINLSGTRRHDLPGQPDAPPSPLRRPGSLTGNPAVARPRRLRHQQHLREGRRAPATSASTALQRNAAGHGHRRQRSRPQPHPRYAGAPRRQAVRPTRRPIRPRTHPWRRPSPRSRAPATPARSPARVVITEGVVTAAYPTGGFNGFYLQTAGTGGDVDPADHAASDAVFVFGSAVAQAVQIGDHVQVTGKVSEFQGTTEITPTAADVKVLPEPASVQPASVVLPRTEAARESLRGDAAGTAGAATPSPTTTRSTSTARSGSRPATSPLFTPTEVADPHDAAAIQAVKDDNAARAVTLDDGATANYLTTAKDTPLPWLTQDHQIRVGAPVTLHPARRARVALRRLAPPADRPADRRRSPSRRPSATPAPTAPRPVGGNVKIASFNVLNYFPTTGADFVASGGNCTWYNDRAGDHVTVNTCTGPARRARSARCGRGRGPRPPAGEDRERDQRAGRRRRLAGGDRELRASSARTATRRSAPWSTPSTPQAGAGHLGVRAHPGRRPATRPTRTSSGPPSSTAAAKVEPVGDSVIDDVPVFDVARDPLAQAFEPVGGSAYSRFLVIVNHFKSKGSGPDDGTGQGSSNPQRIAQAEEVVRFADEMKTQLGTDTVFLSGDFNAYTREDPMQVLYDAGYTDIGSRQSPEEHTYLFDGTVGSLDHVLGNAAAMRTVTGAPRLEPQLGGVGGAGVQPPQLQRDRLLRGRPVPRLRPRPARRRCRPADRRGADHDLGDGQPGALAARPAGREGAGRVDARPGRPAAPSRCGRQASCSVAGRCTTARSR